MMTSHNRASQQALVRRVARRVNLGVFLSQSAVPVAAVLITFGVVFLLSRMVAPQVGWWGLVVLAALPVVLVITWLRCRRRGLFFQEPEVIELVDHLSASDGLVASQYENPMLLRDKNRAAGLWATIAQRLDFSALRLDARWFGWRLLPALAFAAAVLLVPPREIVAPPAATAVSLVQPVAEKIKATAELLPEPERKKLEEQLQQVAAAPDTISKEKWEAVENLEQRLETALAQSEASAYQLSSSMNQLAQKVAEQETKAPNTNSAELQADISTMAANVSDQLSKQQSPMNEEMKKRLEKAMSQCKAGQCNSKELQKLQKELESLADKMKKSPGGKNAGKGGVERGRADAELVFGEEQKLDKSAVDAKQLENQFYQNSDLTDIGITKMEPKPEPGRFAPGTVRDYSGEQGNNVSRTAISPSQRGVVERYFK